MGPRTHVDDHQSFRLRFVLDASSQCLSIPFFKTTTDATHPHISGSLETKENIHDVNCDIERGVAGQKVLMLFFLDDSLLVRPSTIPFVVGDFFFSIYSSYGFR
jgi:hypothetical protein